MKKTSIFVVVFMMGLVGAVSGANAATCKIPPNLQEMLVEAGQLLNAERAKAGRKPLALDSRLQAAAQAHACDMIENDFFSHYGSDGSKPKRRARRQGCRAGLVGENTAAGQATPRELIREWMDSEKHRKILLTGRGLNQFGLGVAKYSHGSFGM